MRGRAAMIAAMLAAGAAAAEPFAYTIVDAATIPAPLGGLAGNARRGAKAAAAACGDCHAPHALAGRSAGTLRLAIVDLSVLHPGLADHAFYEPDAAGRTRLRAAAIEDIVAFLEGQPVRAD